MNLQIAMALALMLAISGCISSSDSSDDVQPQPPITDGGGSSDGNITWPQEWTMPSPGDLQFALPAGSYDLTFFLKEGALISFEIDSPASCEGGGVTGSVIYPETSGGGIHHYITCRDVAPNTILNLQVEGASAHGVLDLA